ncbi:Na/Pi cotransporter family protein [Acetobacteraceae bacterium H6797]|nr:Na/Pi cotransporter family protein [Acetobacteraceae bacterium H6797]
MLASILGGLGLFLVGIREIGARLQQLSGRRMRALVAHATAGPLAASLAGLLLGALTQSSNAATVIAGSMLRTGTLPFHRAMTVVAWSNLGTAGLVMLAALDLRLASLWLLALTGFALHFGLDAGSRLRPALQAVLGLALLLLGLILVKAGAAPLREMEAVHTLLSLAHGARWPAFILACAITLVTQSSSAVTMLVASLGGVGLLSFEQGAMMVYGASLGSGLAIALVLRQFTGAARQLVLYQLFFKLIGTVLALLLFVIEAETGLPLLLRLTGLLAEDAPHRLGWLFLLLQLGTALALMPLEPMIARWLARLTPARGAEALSRPAYLYDRAVEDPPTALTLVEREQARLFLRLPAMLDEPRGERPSFPLPRPDLEAASKALEAEISHFLTALLASGAGQDSLERLVSLEARMQLLAQLRETVGEFAAVPRPRRSEADDRALTALAAMTEALHLLLEEIAQVAEAGAGDLGTLQSLTEDRGEMMEGLRRRLLRSEPGLDQGMRDALFRSTSLFERAVWLIRRGTALMASEAAG